MNDFPIFNIYHVLIAEIIFDEIGSFNAFVSRYKDTIDSIVEWSQNMMRLPLLHNVRSSAMLGAVLESPFWDINTRSYTLGNLLLDTCIRGNVPFCHDLVEKYGLVVNECLPSDGTAFDHAILSNNVDMMDFLYAHGYSISYVSKRYKYTPLMWALETQKRKPLKWLLSLPLELLNLEHRNTFGQRALDLDLDYGQISKGSIKRSINLIKMKQTFYVMRSPRSCPRLTLGKTMNKLTPDHYRLLAKYLVKIKE